MKYTIINSLMNNVKLQIYFIVGKSAEEVKLF